MAAGKLIELPELFLPFQLKPIRPDYAGEPSCSYW